jgi:hypothetical protein
VPNALLYSFLKIFEALKSIMKYSEAASTNPNEVKGRIYTKLDPSRVKILDNFNDFVDFSLNCRFIEEVEGPQKRASRTTCGLADTVLKYFEAFCKVF